MTDNSFENAGKKKKHSARFRKKSVEEYLVGLKTPRELFELHGVAASELMGWLHWYRLRFMGANKKHMKKGKTPKSAGAMEAELARLREELETERLRTAALEHLIKLAKEHHGIDLKKSTGGT